jgi:hypothetical protein
MYFGDKYLWLNGRRNERNEVNKMPYRKRSKYITRDTNSVHINEKMRMKENDNRSLEEICKK